MPTLLLIPTVLAADTQQDVLSLECTNAISSTNVFFVENIKTARRFISSLKLGIVINDLQFEIVDKKTNFSTVLSYLKGKDQNVGVISEAGVPAVADPGSLVVKAAHLLKWKVKPITGPNSILLALMGSGFNGQSFAFNGYLPIKRPEREKKLIYLAKKVDSEKQTQLFMETPFRNNQLLESALQTLPNEIGLSIAANLTSENEIIISKKVKDWKKEELPDLHKQPCIFSIGSLD